MNKKALQWLYQELPGLVDKGVISSDAANKIMGHYGEIKMQDKKRLFLIICSVIGALLIGLGIIMLIAHNWDELSRSMRAFLSFMPLVLGQILVVWVLWKKPKSDAFKESSATFLSLMVGASIALISQTYNISGDTASFILTWMLLIVPIVYLMQATIPAAIYVIGITCWAGNFWDACGKSLFFWLLLIIILPHFIWSIRKNTYVLRSTILSFILTVGICYGAALSLGRGWPGSWIIINSSIFALFYLLGNLNTGKITTNWQRPLRFIGAVGIFVLAFIFTYKEIWGYVASAIREGYKDTSSLGLFFDYAITAGIISGAIVLFLDTCRKKDLLKMILGSLPVLAILGYALNMNANVFPSVIFNIYIFILSVFCIMHGIRNSNLSRVNIGMFMLAILIIARFFDSDINLIFKGLVFIIIGSGFLVTNVVLASRKGGRK